MKRTRLILALLLMFLVLLALLPSLSVQADFGSGWSATFFNNDALQGTGVAVSTISAINFNWGSNPPTDSVNAAIPISNCTSITVQAGKTSSNCADYFSARFTSTQALTPGIYQFVAQSDDGIRVTVNGALIIDDFQPHAAKTDTATVSIATSPVNITVEYFEGIDQALVQLQWFLQGAATNVFGTNVFGFTTTPLTTAVPPLTVSVESVRGLALRSGPYLGASLISVVVPGTEYPPLARNTDEGQFTWYLITVGTHTGWASGRYLQITGDPNSAPLQGTTFDNIDGAPDLGVIGTTRSVMNLRRRPSVRTALLEQLDWGTQVSIIGRTIQDGKNFWFQVRYKGVVGWLFAPFVGVKGNIDAVPIR